MPEPKYKINTGFITQKIDNTITIFSGDTSTLFTLNDTAVVIFEGIKLKWDIEKIADKLTAKYEISKKKVVIDIEEFIDELKKRKIISAI